MADILDALSRGGEAAPTAVMYGIALGDSSDGTVLVQIGEPIEAEFDDDEPEGVVAVDFDGDSEGSLDDLDEDAEADEAGGFDDEGDMDADETTEDDESASGEETAPDAGDELTGGE